MEFLELKNIITDKKKTKKNLLDGLIYRMKMTEDGISELEDTSIDLNQSEQQRECKLKINEYSVKNL